MIIKQKQISNFTGIRQNDGYPCNYKQFYECTLTLTWIHAPVFSLHRLQIRDQRLGGMWETLVMGSILSGQAMLTYTKVH